MISYKHYAALGSRPEFCVFSTINGTMTTTTTHTTLPKQTLLPKKPPKTWPDANKIIKMDLTTLPCQQAVDKQLESLMKNYRVDPPAVAKTTKKKKSGGGNPGSPDVPVTDGIDPDVTTILRRYKSVNHTAPRPFFHLSI